MCGVLLVAGMLFTGCDWFSKDKSKGVSHTASGDDVLLTINGKPALTVQEYEDQLDMACKANPQMEMFLNMIPGGEQNFIFRGMKAARIMKEWAEREGLDKSAEFQKQRKHLHDAMDLQLYMKAFDEAHPIDVSDHDVAKYYDEKKDIIPGLAISVAGVDSLYVNFESKDKADKFYEKVKEMKKANSFKSFAEEHKHQVGQSVINSKSPLAEAVKSSVADLKKFPAVLLVQAGNDAYWVIFASGKSEAKYHDLKSPQVQQGLRKMIADERKEKELETMMEKLQSSYNVVENTKYFENKEARKRAESASALQDADEDQAD